MLHTVDKPGFGWARTAWYGAEAGMAITFLYALAFVGYAALRSALSLLTAPRPDSALTSTLLATWIALAVSSFALAALFGILAALFGALTACVLRALLAGLHVARDPRRAATTGVLTCLIISVALVMLVAGGLGVGWTRATAPTLTFWLVLPLALYVAAGGIASWLASKRLAS